MFFIVHLLSHWWQKNTKNTWETCPALWTVFSSLSKSAGSAGSSTSTVRVSTATTPTGTPPSRARPTTTVFAQPCNISSNESLSKKPLCHWSVSVETIVKMLRRVLFLDRRIHLFYVCKQKFGEFPISVPMRLQTQTVRLKHELHTIANLPNQIRPVFIFLKINRCYRY